MSSPLDRHEQEFHIGDSVLYHDPSRDMALMYAEVIEVSPLLTIWVPKLADERFPSPIDLHRTALDAKGCRFCDPPTLAKGVQLQGNRHPE